jgi:flagellar M-ring protein FliF
MVASALGLDKNRGDKIEVTSMPFLDAKETGSSEGTISSKFYQYMPLIRYALLLAGGALLYFLMIRPLMRTLKRDVTRHYKTVEQMEFEQSQTGPGNAAKGASQRDPFGNIKKDVSSDPAFNAHVLKNWIQDRG